MLALRKVLRLQRRGAQSSVLERTLLPAAVEAEVGANAGVLRAEVEVGGHVARPSLLGRGWQRRRQSSETCL